MSWYIISYDIRDEKRLRRTHYYLKKEAISLQKSVFLFKGKQRKTIISIINRHTQACDDVRLYPITHPNAIWAAGNQEDALDGLGIRLKQPTESSNDNLFTRLLPKIFARS